MPSKSMARLWRPPLCRLGLHRWRRTAAGHDQYQRSHYECERCWARKELR